MNIDLIQNEISELKKKSKIQFDELNFFLSRIEKEYKYPKNNIWRTRIIEKEKELEKWSHNTYLILITNEIIERIENIISYYKNHQIKNITYS